VLGPWADRLEGKFTLFFFKYDIRTVRFLAMMSVRVLLIQSAESKCYFPDGFLVYGVQLIWLSFKFDPLTEGKSKIFCCNHSNIIAVRISGCGVEELLHVQFRLTFHARGFDTSGNNKTTGFFQVVFCLRRVPSVFKRALLVPFNHFMLFIRAMCYEKACTIILQYTCSRSVLV